MVILLNNVKKSAAAYNICLDEMKRVKDMMSTQKTQPYIPSHFSRLTPQGVRNFPAILQPCSRYFVASEGDTAASSCEQSLRCHCAEVLPLPFVVMLPIIKVTSDR